MAKSKVSAPVLLPGVSTVTVRTHSGACRAAFFS